MYVGLSSKEECAAKKQNKTIKPLLTDKFYTHYDPLTGHIRIFTATFPATQQSLGLVTPVLAVSLFQICSQ